MKRLALFFVVCLLVAAAAWYAITHFPQAPPPVADEHRIGPRAARPVIDALPTLSAACGEACGHDRWAVKTLSDPDRGLVDLHPVAETVERLAALPRPTGYVPDDRRAAPVELTTWVVIACLGIVDKEDFFGVAHRSLRAKVEHDRDIHLVIGGLENPRVSLIAEIPDPECNGVCPAGLGSLFARERVTLDSILQYATPSPACHNDVPLVEITGVGFFDHEHGQIGAARNQFELHPVLALRIADSTTLPAR